jgi:hypothetical protein
MTNEDAPAQRTDNTPSAFEQQKFPSFSVQTHKQ